ncbi:MAG: PQQ-binding-like beta-propeller repeat protein, partial [Acidobacteriota bacterium]|nr:PQQ-binding-like beta-propeller repeat protein [Acidobacteriota bacterium]
MRRQRNGPIGLRAAVPAAAGLFLLALSVPPPPATADDWPQWRGPGRDGVSTETGLADPWPAGGPPLLWRIDGLGEGYGTVAVVEGSIYVQGTRGGRSLVFALDASDGSVRWERELGSRLRDGRGNGPRGTPTVAGDSLYALTGVGELARIRLSDGGVAWQRNILRDFVQRNISWGISESPLIEGGWVVVMPGGDEGAIAALDRETGATVWTSTGLTDRTGYSSLIAVDLEDGAEPLRVIVGFTARAGVGVRASDGELLWHYRAPANRTANAATPVYADGLVFYTSDYGTGGGAL